MNLFIETFCVLIINYLIYYICEHIYFFRFTDPSSHANQNVNNYEETPKQHTYSNHHDFKGASAPPTEQTYDHLSNNTMRPEPQVRFEKYQIIF